MALKKMRYSKKKVYVYDGKGAEKYSKLHLLRAFQEVLDRSYDVSFISPKEIIEGLWVKNAAVIAFGGGFDLGFKETLGSEGAKVIKKYVADGGKYLGICAGGYFASEHVEFDKNGPLEVCGRRELNFFQGICKGPVYPGFRYGSFKGSLAVSVELHLEEMKSKLDILYHGGGCFLPGNDAIQDVACTSDFLEPSAKKRSQENLLLNQSFPGNQEKDYTFHPSISVLGKYSNLENKPPAIVLCCFGKGMAILSGVHVEYYSNLLQFDIKDAGLESVVSTLASCEKHRLHCFKLLMKRLLLRVV